MSETISFTPRMGECIIRASEIAREYGHSHVGTEHILLAFLQDEHSIAAQAISRVGDSSEIANALDDLLKSSIYNES